MKVFPTKRQTVAQRGGIATRDKMLAENPNYYSELGKKRAALREKLHPGYMAEMHALGGRVQYLRRLFLEQILDGTLSEDDADRVLLRECNTTMRPKSSVAYKKQRREELGL